MSKENSNYSLHIDSDILSRPRFWHETLLDSTFGLFNSNSTWIVVLRVLFLFFCDNYLSKHVKDRKIFPFHSHFQKNDRKIVCWIRTIFRMCIFVILWRWHKIKKSFEILSPFCMHYVFEKMPSFQFFHDLTKYFLTFNTCLNSENLRTSWEMIGAHTIKSRAEACVTVQKIRNFTF